jgi:hypothetical protein
MGKASRRRRHVDGSGASARQRVDPVPFEPRPFAGLPGETDWVAIREILPAATARVRLLGPHAEDGTEMLVTTVLPLAWPGLHRTDGQLLVATQSGSSSGDASRDLAAQMLATIALDAGTPLVATPAPTRDTPRLQDVLDTSVPFEVEIHEGFDFWAPDQELDEAAQASLERANEAIVPTVAMTALPSAYWVRIGGRTHVRLVLPDEEDAATDALARLHAADTDGLGGETRLLGAFRTSGLLVPVWDLDPELEATDYEDPLAQWANRYAAALAEDAPLTPDERRARSGLLSRQVTLR